MKISELFNISKIDYTNLVVNYDTFVNFKLSNFEISPKEFLEYSKQDNLDKNPKGLINAISNAKRAIDCQIDSILMSLGYNYIDLPEYLNDFVKRFKIENKELPYKLSILNCLNITPGNIIAEVRQLRHQLEHYYKLPNKNTVSKAIEVAELFINATDHYLFRSLSFELTDKKKSNKDEKEITGIRFYYETEKNVFELLYFHPNNKRMIVEVENSQKEYAALLKMFMSYDSEIKMLESIKYFLSLFKDDFPLDRIRIENFEYVYK